MRYAINLLCSAVACAWLTAISPSSVAQDIEKEIDAVEAELPAAVEDPVKLNAIRALAGAQISYRIATKFLGYEDSKEFGPVWENFNYVMHGEGLNKVREFLKAKGGGDLVDSTFVDAAKKAYEKNKDSYEKLVQSIAKDYFGIDATDQMKERFLRAMIAYAIMNWINEPKLDADWNTQTWTFPTCTKE